MPYIGNELATQFQAFVTQTITGDGSTGYTLDRAVANGKELLVYINNVKQEEGSGKAYTASGTTITFSDAVASTDSCYVVFLGSAVGTIVPPDASVGSTQLASGAVTSAKLDTNIAVSGTLGVTGAVTANGGAVFNEDSADVDFRIESNGNANMLVIDGGDDIMAIGAAKSTSATVKIQNKDDSNTNTLDLFNDNGNRTVSMQQDTSGNAKMKFQKNDGTVTTTIDANLGGILFGTDTAAANTLDDYEEGTWTPSVGGNASYHLQSGKYTKVGRTVHVSAVIQVNALGTGSTTEVSGFPFTSSHAGGANMGGSVGFWYSLAVNVLSLNLYYSNGTTTTAFKGNTSASGNISSNLAIFGNSARVDFSITYETS